jgi:hypothetical protein
MTTLLVAFGWVSLWMLVRSLFEAPHDWFIQKAAQAGNGGQGTDRVRYTRFWHNWDMAAHAWAILNAAAVVAVLLVVPISIEPPLLAALIFAAALALHAVAVRAVVFEGFRNNLAGQSLWFTGSVDILDQLVRSIGLPNGTWLIALLTITSLGVPTLAVAIGGGWLS